jgi:predicted GNAT family acetyltransferase
VRRNDDRSRYELVVEDEVIGIADFQEAADDTVVFPHTEIDLDRRGQGFGAELVRGALDDVRSRRQTVVPRCWYVRQFIAENPSYRDLLAA